MVEVSHADRVVFPEVGRTKGEVVAYYERIAARALPHLAERPLSIKRYPKGIGAPGFFQKNVPPHYPKSMNRVAIPRSAAAARKTKGKRDDPEVTVYPIVRDADELAFLANQGAIELHVPTSRASSLLAPDRLVIDLDPPPGAVDLVRRAAFLARDALGALGLPTVPVATGSKGYHLVATIAPTLGFEVVGAAMQKAAALLAARHPDELTITFRIAARGHRVFVDWLRNFPVATVVAPFSLRARARATVAAPLAWSEVEATPPDAFAIGDVERLLDRPDPLAELASRPIDAAAFSAAVDAAFADAGLVLQPFDRFRA
jgi:bifunctional non-homologous end joining protein LigD